MKTFIKTAFICGFVLLLAATTVMAQGQLRVKFKVLDEDSKKPVAGAKVTAYQPERPNNKWNDTSDANGEFIVIGMSPGQAIVEIVADGYYNAKLPIRLRTGRERTEYTLEIKPFLREKGKATPEIMAKFQEGMKLFDAGKYDEALAIYLDINQKYPDLEEMYVTIATTYHSLKQPEKVLEWLLKGTAQYPENDNLWLRIAEQYVEMGKNADAIEWYKKIIAKTPTDSYSIEKVALLDYTEGNYDEAITYYTMAIGINKDNALPYYYIGNIYYVKDQFDKALENYEMYAKLDATNQYGGLNQAQEMIKDCKNKLQK